MALEITDANFEETVLNSSKPVMVDFWAAWCGPCRMVGPIIDEISTPLLSNLKRTHSGHGFLTHAMQTICGNNRKPGAWPMKRSL